MTNEIKWETLELWVRQHFSNHQLFDDRIREIALALAKLQKITYYDPAQSYTHETEYDYAAGTITAHWDEYYRGDTSHETITFPIDYLWMPDFLAVATAAWEASEKARIEAAKVEEQTRALRLQQETEQKQRKLYQELHEKFGGRPVLASRGRKSPDEWPMTKSEYLESVGWKLVPGNSWQSPITLTGRPHYFDLQTAYELETTGPGPWVYAEQEALAERLRAADIAIGEASADRLRQELGHPLGIPPNY